MEDLIATFVFFFAVIDPIGTVPVFIAVTRKYDKQYKRRIAIKATLIAALILLFFVAAGEIILRAMSIPLEAFEIAGGIVLLIFALSMIFGDSKPEEEMKMVDKGTEEAVFPLAIPSIASPGAMLAAVLLTENDRFAIVEQAYTAGMMVLVLLLTLLLMLASDRVFRLLGKSGANIISRVMGLILASVAVASVLAGIKDYFAINPA